MASKTAPKTAELQQELFNLYRDNFILENKNLHGIELCRQWSVQALKYAIELPLASIPRIPVNSSRMGRGPISMTRSQSTQDANARVPDLSMQRSGSIAGTRRSSQAMAAVPMNITTSVPALVPSMLSQSYPLLSTSPSNKFRRTNSGHRQSMPSVPEISMPEYDPVQWLQCSDLAQGQWLQPQSPQQHRSSGFQDAAFDFPQPTTPALSREPSPVFSIAMSRESSAVTNGLTQAVDMMRIRSTQSNYSVCQEPTPYSTSLPAVSMPYSQSFLSKTSPQDNPNITRQSSENSSETIKNKPMNWNDLSQHMALRTASQRRNLIQSSQSSESIVNNDPLTSYPMVAVRSQDGKEKYQISRAAPFRHIREKLKCTQCNRHPEGFRGEHELRRHIDRAHPKSTQKVWICVDASPDGQYLSRCKACTTQKRYGAYYNAAAHLRRVHFNPKKAGPKVKGVADRAGKGGGDWPPMETLKNFWMKEHEEFVVKDESGESDESNDDLLDNTLDLNYGFQLNQSYVSAEQQVSCQQPSYTSPQPFGYGNDLSFDSSDFMGSFDPTIFP